MTICYFIGVDVSKATLDWAVFDGKTTVLKTQSSNSPVAIRATVKLIKTLPGFTMAESICCLEHTGIYCAHLLSSLYKLKLPIWLESSLQIKKAGGLQRGKSDTIDAVRIAEYARAGGPVSFSRQKVFVAAAKACSAKAGSSECPPSTASSSSSANAPASRFNNLFKNSKVS